MNESLLKKLRECVTDLRIREVRAIVKQALDAGITPQKIFTECITRAMEIVGQKYEAGEYFLAELLAAAEVVNEAMIELGPRLRNTPAQVGVGKIVLGTVRGDMHDIGKNIFKMMAESAGFTVKDLGVDVNPEKFVQQCEEEKPDVLALSCLLTTALPEIKVVIDMVRKDAATPDLRTLIGGNAVTKAFGKEVGADEAALNAIEGVNFCKSVVKP